ncbi:MAG: molybdate ABC transporter permease subunit [Pseudomonadota bacterium]
MGLDAGAAEALRLSLWVASLATLLSLPLALGLAWLLARRDFPGKGLLNAAILLPLVLPPVVTGYLLLLAFGRTGPVGRTLEAAFGLVFAFNWTGAVLAAMVMGLPLMVRAMRLAFEATPPGLEEAAATLGAPSWAVFTTVTLPLIAPGVLAGTVLGFAKALGEFGATITFVAAIPGQTLTLPSAIYNALQVPGGEARAAALTLWAIAVAVAAVLISEWLARRMAR